MQQRTFFDEEFDRDLQVKRMARRSDAVSSHEAASDLVRSGALGEQARAVLDALQRFNHSTSAELAERAGLDRVMVARRLPDLERVGLVVRNGVRACVVSGRNGIEWGGRGYRSVKGDAR